MTASLFLFAAIAELAIIGVIATWGARTYDEEEAKTWDEAQR
jgi:hypothetical protein